VPAPFWVDVSVVLAVNDEQLAEHGGASGMRDPGLLESALARPRNRYAYDQASLHALAARYAYGIAKNHPFVDGNKRTSLVIAELFLNLNGIELTASDEAVVITWLRLAAGGMSEAELESWITENSRRMFKAK
jgi:death on curing protein